MGAMKISLVLVALVLGLVFLISLLVFLILRRTDKKAVPDPYAWLIAISTKWKTGSEIREMYLTEKKLSKEPENFLSQFYGDMAVLEKEKLIEKRFVSENESGPISMRIEYRLLRKNKEKERDEDDLNFI